MTTTPASPEAASTQEPTLVDRALKIFADVQPGEGVTALLLMFNVFLLLLAYYLLKPVRESLILVGGGAEVKSYASTGQALLLAVWVPLYGQLAQRVGRMKLITIVTLFFVGCLVGFYFLAQLKVPLGIPFFLWVGVFNLSVIAQFWGFAADVYTPEQGKRLFAIIGIGSSVGAVAGTRITKALEKTSPYTMMLLAAAVLILCLGMTWFVNQRVEANAKKGGPNEKAEEPLGKGGGFAMLLADRYLLLIGVLMLILNCVNSTGEYVLDKTLLAAAAEHGTGGLTEEQFIRAFKADYFAWVNICGAVMQLFIVSRVIKYIGVRGALFVMPLVSLGGYTTMAIGPILSLIFVAKIAENTLDYSLQNTTRQALFLPTSREAKYKAKAAIDTFIVRAGDVMSTALVWVGSHLAFKTGHFALANVILVIGWLGIAAFLGKEYQRRAAETAPVPDSKAIPATT